MTKIQLFQSIIKFAYMNSCQFYVNLLLGQIKKAGIILPFFIS